MVADNNGNIFFIGLAGDKTRFGSSEIQSMPARNSICYVAKLSSSGAWQFAKTLTEIQVVPLEGTQAAPNLMAVDNDNNIYISLTVQNDPNGDLQYILGSPIDPSFMNPYLVKMDNDGNLIWLKSFGTNTASNSDNYGTGICFQNNNLYVTGAIRGGYLYSSFSNLTVSSTNSSYFLEYIVAKADLDGNFQWVTRFSGGSNVGGFAVAAFDDNVYTTGYYRVNITTLGPLSGNYTSSDVYKHQIFFGKIKDQYIKVGAVSPTTLCPGSTFIIPFTSYGLTLSNTNTFTAQLSDANGSFANAVNIGSTTSTGTGSITATLPANLIMGSSGYKVRIVSSDLLNTGFPYYAYADINYSVAVGNQTFYQDADGDGYGNPAVSLQTCTPPSDYVLDNTDCNDNDISLHLPVTYYRDADEDGFGELNNLTTVCSNTTPTGYVINSTDCDDAMKLYRDADNDGYGSNVLVDCGGVQNNTDCSDNNANVKPGIIEVCGNGIDDNCDGQIDEGCTSNTVPTISINDQTVYESQGMVVLTVSLSNVSTAPVKLAYTTVDGTANSKGSLKSRDYILTKGTLTIPVGSLSSTISVPLYSDNISEPSEYFRVQLSRPTNASINDGSGTVTILDGSALLTVTKSTVKAMKIEPVVLNLTVNASPNPSGHYFTLVTESNNHQMLKIKVVDVLGRLMESRSNVVPNGIFRMGDAYRPGVYFIEVTQGSESRQLKLVKQAN